MTKFKIALAAAVATFALSTQANALTLGSTPCALTDITPSASACGGWYTSNLINSSPASLADQAAALNALLGTSLTAGTVSWTETLSSISGGTIDFATSLFGDTVIGVHVGTARGAPGSVGYQGTAFFRFDAGNLVGGLNTIGFNRPGLSNSRLYYTGTYVPPMPTVPEPTTWALLIAGFGLVGASMRRRKSIVVSA